MTTTATPSAPSAPSSPSVPSIHLNGTGATTLWREYHAAYKTIDTAVDALVEATCNERDFYPQGPTAFEKARKERDEALTKLRDTKAYVEHILMGILSQSADCDQS